MMYDEDKFIRMSDGVELRASIREIGSKTWIIATHGAGEHLERHEFLNDLFGNDFNIVRYDLRGHGRSMGTPAYVEDFFDYIDDLKQIIDFLHKRYRMDRYILFGHSLGGVILSGFLQKYTNYRPAACMSFLSSPAISLLSGLKGTLIKVVPTFLINYSCILPISIPLSDLLNLNHLSHDINIAKDYAKNSLNHNKLHSKFVFELIKAGREIFSSAINPSMPTYCAIGKGDRIVNVNAVVDYFSCIESSVTLKLFDYAYHELHHEVYRYRKPYFEYLNKIFFHYLASNERLEL